MLESHRRREIRLNSPTSQSDLLKRTGGVPRDRSCEGTAHRGPSSRRRDATVGAVAPPADGSIIPLAVKPASSPDDVLWENLGVPHLSKMVRRFTTVLLSVLLLALTSVSSRASRLDLIHRKKPSPGELRLSRLDTVETGCLGSRSIESVRMRSSNCAPVRFIRRLVDRRQIRI